MKCYLLVFSVLGSVLARNTCHYDKTLDPSSKTYLSPVVFLGKLTSLNHNENIVRTRFNVKRLFKNAGLASKQKKIRLEYRNATFCELPKNMELMKDYLVFMRVNYSDVEPLFLPEPVTRKMMKDVRKIACQNCAQPPSVRQLEDVFIKSGGRLKLHCRVDGNPLPSIQWFKNGKKIESKGRIKIKNKRKQSKLIIKTVRHKDSGEYECQASNVVQYETVSAKAIVMVIKNLPATATTKHMGIDMGIPCPVDTFCLNGANCTFYEIFGEYVCNCAEGFMGQRCDHKSVPVVLGEVNQREEQQGSLFYVITGLFGASVWIIIIMVVIIIILYRKLLRSQKYLKAASNNSVNENVKSDNEKKTYNEDKTYQISTSFKAFRTD